MGMVREKRKKKKRFWENFHLQKKKKLKFCFFFLFSLTKAKLNTMATTTTTSTTSTTSTTTTCTVCTNNFNNKRIVICNGCDYQACQECCQTFILGQTVPHCMNCRVPWTRLFMVENFPKTFIRGALKQAKETFLFDKEKALLPATQVVIEEENRKMEFVLEIDKINKIKEKIEIEYKNKLKQFKLELNELNHKLFGKYTPASKTFIRACPREECKGFLDTHWHCGLCKHPTCSECLAVLPIVQNVEEPHLCKEDDVETAKLIAKDTRPCPNCATGIFKISGCDQMFCTSCNTAFKWSSGKIVTQTIIHNPHFFEWQRMGGGEAQRNPQDVPCGRDFNNLFIRDFMKNIRCFDNQPIDTKLSLCFSTIMQKINHLRTHEMVGTQFRAEAVLNFQDLRIQFMKGIITETDFKTKIQRKHKHNDKKKEMGDLLELLVHSIEDILYRMNDDMFQHIKKKSCSQFVCQKYLDEIVHLVEYLNSCFNKISEAYDCIRYCISFNTHNESPLLKYNETYTSCLPVTDSVVVPVAESVVVPVAESVSESVSVSKPACSSVPIYETELCIF